MTHLSPATPPSLPYNMKSIYLKLSVISMPLCHKHISVSLSHLDVLLRPHSRAAGMCIPQWLHRGRGYGTSCSITIFAFQCRYIKLSLIIPWLCALYGHPSTGHVTEFNTRGKDTTYVSSPPPLTSTPQVYGMTIPWDISTWWRSDNVIIAVPHLLQLTLVFLLSMNVAPSSINLRLYATTTC